MSLVYDALRQQAGAAQPGRPLPRASWWARRSPTWRGGLLLAAGAALAAPLAFLAASMPEPVSETLPAAVETFALAEPIEDADTSAGAHQAAMARAPAPAAAAGPAALPVVDVAEAIAASPAGPASGSGPDTAGDLSAAMPAPVPVPVAAAAPPVPAAAPQASAPGPAPAPAPAAPDAAASTPINITVAQRGTGRGPDAADGAVVGQSVRAIEDALAAGDTAGARQALDALGGVLHGDSLTLLRMQAWVAHRSDEMDAAEQLYRRIAARVPDDLNAGVNIALLDARRGDVADARKRLQRLASRHARSPQVARALTELEALPR